MVLIRDKTILVKTLGMFLASEMLKNNNPQHLVQVSGMLSNLDTDNKKKFKLNFVSQEKTLKTSFQSKKFPEQ
jgi:hypothetical protein